MTVKELIELLAKQHPNTPVIVMVDGSAYATDSKEENEDYNDGASPDEFFIVTTDWETT